MIDLVNMGTGQNCKKTKLHKDKFAQGDKIVLRKTFAPRVNFARVTILHKSKKTYTYKLKKRD